MVGDYVTKLYAPAARASRALAADEDKMARRLATWKSRVRRSWSGVRIEHVEADGAEPSLGAVLDVRVTASLGDLAAEDVCVELVYGRLGEDDELVEPSYVTLTADDSAQAPTSGFPERWNLASLAPSATRSGSCPSHPLLASRAELGLVVYPDAPAACPRATSADFPPGDDPPGDPPNHGGASPPPLPPHGGDAAKSAAPPALWLLLGLCGCCLTGDRNPDRLRLGLGLVVRLRALRRLRAGNRGTVA